MGVSIDIKKASADHYTVQRGITTLFGGGPIIEGNGFDNTTSAIVADISYKINMDGNVAAWSFFQTEATTLPIAVGQVKLVILRQDGTDYTIVGVGEMDRDINTAGAIEFPCEIEVMRNDIVGIWLKAATSAKVSTQTDLDNPTNTNLLLEFLGITDPQPEDNLGVPDVVTGGIMYSVAVRGEIEDGTIEDVTDAWYDSGANDDTFNFAQFATGLTSGLAAFVESNVTSSTSLFDSSTGSSASVALGLTTLNNVYYYLGIGTDTTLVPVERLAIHVASGVIAAGGRVRIYGSVDVAQVTPVSLVKAQAVTGWTLLFDFTSGTPTAALQNAFYHVAQSFKWLRLNIVGATAAATTVAAFEAEVHNTHVTNGELLPHSDAALKNKFHFNGTSKPELAAISTLITRTVTSTDTVVYVENAATAFFTQIRINGYVYLRHNLPRGSNDVMKPVTVIASDPGNKTLTLSAQAGEDFQIGDIVDPEVWFFKFRAYDASDVLFGVSNWIGYFNTQPAWIRSHNVYTAAGN